ncbi:MAG: sugar ABC transporter ATP-binding protein [Mycobacterium sp.]
MTTGRSPLSLPSAVSPTEVHPVLEVRDLQKVYGGTAALSGVNLRIAPGEVHALLGENGAGKSTLVKILAAVEHEDGGEILLGGAHAPGRRTPRFMTDQGVVFIHQDLGLVETMSIAENIAAYAGYPLGRTGIRWTRTRDLARTALAKLDVDLNPDTPVAELSIAEQATVAIARALVLDARLIVLDEPTASLAAGEASRLLEILRTLRNTGLSCLLVTHRLDEVLSHCDQVTVLRNGTLACSRPVAGLTQAALIEMIVGHVPEMPARASGKTSEAARLSIANLSGPGFNDVTFDVSHGEIVAVTGFADGGHLAVLASLYGAQHHNSGRISLDNRDYTPVSPTSALERGIHYVPPDRNREGLAGSLTIRENMFPNPPARFRPMDRRGERDLTAKSMSAFDVRPRDCEAAVAVLSGGNAQKILIARALAQQPRLLLLCEPTSGVDIGARTTIYQKLREASAAGMPIVVASSDFQEVADLADRAVVLCRGAITRVLAGADLTVASLTGASYGT